MSTPTKAAARAVVGVMTAAATPSAAIAAAAAIPATGRALVRLIIANLEKLSWRDRFPSILRFRCHDNCVEDGCARQPEGAKSRSSSSEEKRRGARRRATQ